MAPKLAPSAPSQTTARAQLCHSPREGKYVPSCAKEGTVIALRPSKQAPCRGFARRDENVSHPDRRRPPARIHARIKPITPGPLTRKVRDVALFGQDDVGGVV